jgi:hypothetical protein
MTGPGRPGGPAPGGGAAGIATGADTVATVGTAASVAAVLGRIRRAPRLVPGERCEMCGEPVAAQHSHVVDVTNRALLCTCRPCALLFDYPGARLRYKAVPDRWRRLASLPAPVWDDLQIPVGVAFFFTNSTLERVVGIYPSPAGATESELPLGSWDAVLAAEPELAGLVPDVEALLVRVTGSSQVDGYLVPIDVCYELVGHLRTFWRGFDGGQDVRRRLADFFERVEGRCP